MNHKKNIFIFGLLENADIADFYFSNDSEKYNVIGFTVDDPNVSHFNQKPVLGYEELKINYKPDDVEIFAPISKNLLRKSVYERIKNDGYALPTYISSKCQLWNSDAIGENCFIQEMNNIQYGTTIGDNCILWAGNHIGHHSKIGGSVQITSHVVISGRNNVGDLCYFGVNSSTRDGLNICSETVLGMSSGLIKNTRSPGLYTGFPAVYKGSAYKYI